MVKSLESMARAVDFAISGSSSNLARVVSFLSDKLSQFRALSLMPREQFHESLAESRRRNPQDPEETYSPSRRRFLANFFKAAAAAGIAAYSIHSIALLSFGESTFDHPVFGRNIGWGRDGQGHVNGWRGPQTRFPAIDFPASYEQIVCVAPGRTYSMMGYREENNPYDIFMTHEVMNGIVKSNYVHNSAVIGNAFGKDFKRGEAIAITGKVGTENEHLHLAADTTDPEDFGFYEKQPVQGFTNLPYYDGKADLDSALRVRPRQRLLQERLDTLDQRMGNYDGPLRKELNSLKSDPAKLFRRLYDEVAFNLVFLPGEDGYRLFLEGNLYVQHPYMKKIAFTHPFKPAKLVNRYA